jgi:NAD(P)-dependent dehydrogenase (short-subunit alcohol dehydrogenase family)
VEDRGQVALVTGASRGIGRETALSLARAGFDVAIAARTVHEGEGKDEVGVLRPGERLPGSLDSTLADLNRLNGRALAVRMDLCDRQSVLDGISRVTADLGPIDVLVNNAVYFEGNLTLLQSLTVDTLARNLEANAISPVLLALNLLPGMAERGRGTVINMVSGAGRSDPPAPAGQGGWGLCYGMSKGALQRLTGIIHAEYRDQGVRAFNLDPGFVLTEIVGRMPGFSEQAQYAVSPTVAASVIAWLVTDPGAERFSGETIEAAAFAQEHDIAALGTP